MNIKLESTIRVLQILGIDTTEKTIRKTIPKWWFSTRKKEKGGLRLTKEGFNSFRQAGIKDYQIKFTDQFFLTNQLVIWIDNFIDCPFYLDDNAIYVYSDKMAVQLVLFSGNLYNYSWAKFKNKKQAT